MSEVKLERPKHPPIAQLLKVAKALVFANIKEVGLVGGDPASHPDVTHLAKFFHANNVRVSILSNTHSYPRSSLPEIAQYTAVFETTFHAPDAAKHDAFCQHDGAYCQVIKILRQIPALSRDVGVVINILPQTVAHIFNIVHSIAVRENIPVSNVTFQRVIPFGGAKANKDFRINRDHVMQTAHEVERIEKELNIKISFEDPLPLCVIPENLKKYMHPCEWGITKVSVDALGNLSRCGADPRGSLGNLFETPLQELWNKSQQLSVFRNRDYLPLTCHRCAKVKSCGGGCPLSGETSENIGRDCLL